jgi:putative membrane protein
MSTIAAILVVLVALFHLWFLALEMFLWQKPLGLRTFRLSPEAAAGTATLAANQGLYNGFLAVGLLLTLLTSGQVAFDGRVFLLGCVIVAGVYGAVTVQRGILFVQALPALLAILAVIAAGSN